MSTLSEREAALRRALLAAAEQIEPAPDGLQRIQARLRPPQPMAIAWIQGLWASLARRAPSGVHAAGRRLVKAAQPAWEGLRGRPASHAGPRSMGWAKPLAAMSVAVFVIAAGAYVAFSGSTFLGSPTGSSYAPAGGHSGSPGAGRPKGTARSYGTGSPSVGPSSSGPGPSSTPCASPSTKASSPPASSSPPSPSSTPTTPPSPTPTPTVSPSGSPIPSTSAGAQTGPAGSSSSAAGSSKLTAFIVGQTKTVAQAPGTCRRSSKPKRHKVSHSVTPDASITAADSTTGSSVTPAAAARLA